MIFLQIISLLVLLIIIVLLYYSVHKMMQDKQELYSIKEDTYNQDNLDLTNKQ
jgi:uncharacterized membrane protein